MAESMIRIGGIAVVTALGLAACAARAKPATLAARVVPVPTVAVGSCALPEHDGIVSSSPRLERADRDLDGDGVPEIVVVDRAACVNDGNCYGNVFLAPRADEATSCSRYAGTWAGAVLEPLRSHGDHGMVTVRGYWKLGGDRVLLQDYRYSGGGYQLTSALLCRTADDDRLQCADDHP